jgi:hypothetical protein
MTSLAAYDGATLIYAGNFVATGTPNFTTVYAASGPSTVTAGSCTNTTVITCTMTFTAAVGTHTFGIVTYPNDQSSASTSTPPAFTGQILSEGEVATTIAQGTNPGTTMTLLGVAFSTSWGGSTTVSTGSDATFTYQVLDAGGSQIVQPGNYDNGPVTITTASGNVTFAPVSNAAPPAALGDQSFTMHCSSAGPATFTASANAAPNTAYPFGLTYGSSNYASATLGTLTVNCVNR